MKCKDLKFKKLRGQWEALSKVQNWGALESAEARCIRKHRRWRGSWFSKQTARAFVCLGDGGVWLGALRIESCLNSATHFICASKGRGIFVRACVRARNLKAGMTGYRQSGKRPMLVIPVSLMQMNAISGSPQQNYLMWQGEYNPTS